MSHGRLPIHVQRLRTPAFAVALAALVASQGGAALAQGAAAKTVNGARGVTALGRLEPEGGIVRLSLPSTPEAISGAVIAKLQVGRGADVQAGQLLAEADTVGVLKALLDQARAELETARRDARAAVSVADEACVLADAASRQSKRQAELLSRKLTSDDIADQAKGNADAGAATCKARRASASVAESRIAGAEAGLARHQAELERAYLRAPPERTASAAIPCIPPASSPAWGLLVSQPHLLTVFYNILLTAFVVYTALQEERQMIALFGDKYRAYRKQIPFLLPYGFLKPQIRKEGAPRL